MTKECLYGEMALKVTNLPMPVILHVMQVVNAQYIVEGYLPDRVEAVYHRDHGVLIQVWINDEDNPQNTSIWTGLVKQWEAAGIL